MTTQKWVKFILLCAIWSSSFVFIRIFAPVLGPALTAAGRLGIAGLVLIAYLRVIGFDSKWREYRGLYFRIGLLASSVPFSCFAIGALQLPASLLGILNACTPLFGAIFAALWLGEGFGLKRAIGVFLGLVGVTLANGLGNVELSTATFIAIGVTVIAPLCYALSGVFIELRASHLPSQGIAEVDSTFGRTRRAPGPAGFSPGFNFRIDRNWSTFAPVRFRQCLSLSAFLSSARRYWPDPLHHDHVRHSRIFHGLGRLTSRKANHSGHDHRLLDHDRRNVTGDVTYAG